MGITIRTTKRNTSNMAKSCTTLLLFLLAQNVRSSYLPTPAPSGYSYSAPTRSDDLDLNPLARLALNIHGGGTPGVDYPILSTVPDTGFSCNDYSYSGYFADTSPQSRCQVFHMCHSDGLHDAFLCPNGTIFNQQTFVCELWFNVDCAASSARFDLNLAIGKVPEVRQAVKPKSFYETPVQKPEVLYKTPVQEPEVLYKAPVQEPKVLIGTTVQEPEVLTEITIQEPEVLYKTPVQEPKQHYQTPVVQPRQIQIAQAQWPKQSYRTPGSTSFSHNTSSRY